MSTKQGYIKDFESNKMLPETTTVMVTDVARSQALSASLLALVEKNALGYPDFTTTEVHPVGQEVFHDRKLWKFTAELAEGAQWDSTKVREFSLKEYCDAIAARVSDLEENAAMKDGFYEDLTAGNAVNILSEDVVTEQTTLDITAPNNEIGNGSARMQTIEGDGVAWSQLYDKNAGGASVASEDAQLEFLYGKVVERFSNYAGTTPMPSLFLREFLTGADLTGRVAVTGEGFVPTVTEENQSNYTGLHYKVQANHVEATASDQPVSTTVYAVEERESASKTNLGKAGTFISGSFTTSGKTSASKGDVVVYLNHITSTDTWVKRLFVVIKDSSTSSFGAEIVSFEEFESKPSVTEGDSITYTPIAFFVGGSNFSASAKRNVIDMALAFGIEGYGDSRPFQLPTSAPSTLAAMYGWLGSKVGLRDDYDYNGGELIGVKVLQLRSMPGVNLLDPTSGVALCPYYEWENADGLYRVMARNGAVISGVAATALGGQPVAVVEVTAGSVYEVSVPEGDAVVMQVTLSSGSLADCACWQVWDDATPSDEVGGYTRSVLELPITRIVGQQDGSGNYVRMFPQGMLGCPKSKDLLDITNDNANVEVCDLLLSSKNWSYDRTGKRFECANLNNMAYYSANVISCIAKGYPYSSDVWAHDNGQNITQPISFVTNNNRLLFRDSRFTDATNLKAYFTSNNIHMWYPYNNASKKHFTNLYLLPADAEGDTFAELPAGSVPLATYFPGTYQVGNTGVTMQTPNWDDQTQRFAATPQSAAAKTSSVMPGNYVEMLRSLQQKNILDGWVSPDQMHAHQSATVQALNAMATANQLSGQFTLTPQDDVAYSNE